MEEKYTCKSIYVHAYINQHTVASVLIRDSFPLRSQNFTTPAMQDLSFAVQVQQIWAQVGVSRLNQLNPHMLLVFTGLLGLSNNRWHDITKCVYRMASRNCDGTNAAMLLRPAQLQSHLLLGVPASLFCAHCLVQLLPLLCLSTQKAVLVDTCLYDVQIIWRNRKLMYGCGISIPSSPTQRNPGIHWKQPLAIILKQNRCSHTMCPMYCNIISYLQCTLNIQYLLIIKDIHHTTLLGDCSVLVPTTSLKFITKSQAVIATFLPSLMDFITHMASTTWLHFTDSP